MNTAKINNAALKILPKNAYNCYFPIPFKKISITLTNNSGRDCCIWFMASWQRYEKVSEFTSLRFRVYRNFEYPAQPAGSYLMADISGHGFIAGMALATEKRDSSDKWYHNGGDLWMIDGEGDARAMRGIGGEDVFNMSFGISDVQSEWSGCHFLRKTDYDSLLGSGYEGISCRIFGPDPVWFESSAVIRFGSKANNYESVIYAYVCDKAAKEIISPAGWELMGPFECNSWDDFVKEEWPQFDKAGWPSEHTPKFGQYIAPSVTDGDTFSYCMPIHENSEHGWCDFARNFRGRQRTNQGTQAENVSAYAYAEITLPEKDIYKIMIGYDDWLRLWINGEEVFAGKHENGFLEDSIDLELPGGTSEILIKLSNFNNFQWRLWTFCFRIGA